MSNAVRAVIMERLDVELERLVPDARFIEDLGVGPLDLIELADGLSEEFDLEIPDRDVGLFSTVGQALDYIATRIAAMG